TSFSRDWSSDVCSSDLDGEQALAYARSRHAEYHTEDGWVADPQSDLSRIVRQQNLMAAALDEALDQVTNPIRLRELIDIGTDSVDRKSVVQGKRGGVAG